MGITPLKFYYSRGYADRYERSGYGIYPETQEKVLEDMEHLVSTCRVGNRKGLLPFQRGKMTFFQVR